MARPSTATSRRWSQRVTETSDALDLEPGVFRSASPRAIAASLKRSADRSTRRKTTPFRSAMSMLTFYENRAGRNLSRDARARLDAAKDELRRLYGRPPASPPASGRPSSAAQEASSRRRGGARRGR